MCYNYLLSPNCSGICVSYVLTHTNTTMASKVDGFAWWKNNNIIFRTKSDCRQIALVYVPGLKLFSNVVVFCFWPRYVVIWSRTLAAYIGPRGVICTNNTAFKYAKELDISPFFVCCILKFSVSRIYILLPSKSHNINGSVRSDHWLSEPRYWVIYCSWTE